MSERCEEAINRINGKMIALVDELNWLKGNHPDRKRLIRLVEDELDYMSRCLDEAVIGAARRI